MEKAFFWKLADFSSAGTRMGSERKRKKIDYDFNFIVEVTSVQRLGRTLCIFQTVSVVKSFFEP